MDCIPWIEQARLVRGEFKGPEQILIIFACFPFNIVLGGGNQARSDTPCHERTPLLSGHV
jgi:hypothetical protein